MKLSDVVNRINGNVDRFTTDLEYYVGGEHFDSCELEISRKGLIKPNLNILGFKFHFAFQERDVIFMARNPHLRKAGMVFFSGLCSDASYILRSKNETILTQEYLAVMLQSDHFWDYCEAHKVGSVNFAINWKTMANYEFDLPTIEQQKIVAEKVWAAYRLKQSYRSLISATDEIVKSQFIEMFGDLDTNVKCYPITTVEKVALNLFAGGDKPDDISIDITDKYTYPVWANGEGERGLMGYAKTYRVDKEALTISARGTIGYCAIREPYFTPIVRLITLVPNETVDIVYLKYFFDQTGFESTGAVQGQLTIPTIKLKKVLLPPIEEQKKFTGVVKQADKSKYLN